MIAVNLTGAFLCCSAVIGRMVAARCGAIVNVSSIAGKTAGAYAAHYCASKAGLIGLTQAFARELAAHSVRVNAVCPGFIETAMLDKFLARQAVHEGRTVEVLRSGLVTASGWNRLGTTNEVASAVAFLLSEDATFITGQALNVSGMGEVH
ncbi:MAG: SDR family oxidoreductase [Spirochaetaceae bacterium]|nr:SDR family oxidoreductase [Spirochaetaceae bacterium]